MALARKWRPRSFAEMVGQEHVVRALANALTQGRLHHAYLFTGTRGVGKTTLARILAKCLNCESGPTATPCGVCPACQAIEAGRFVDLIEIDAASYTGVDNMREVLDNAQYAPTAGRYKVYIIDEVHMLSKSAFNAMLKTLEEPPAHVVFVLATTDPQKVPVTVLSRCLQFNLKQLPAARIAEHLGRVLAAEAVQYEPAALELLARAAAGSVRDALSLTDQAIAYGAGRVSAAEVAAMLGVIDRAYLLPLLEALAAGDGPRLLREAENLAERSLSFDAALQDLAGLLHEIALLQVVPQAVQEDLPERDRLVALAERLDAETVQLYYQIATLGRRDLDWAPDEYTGFRMTLLRMLAFVPEDSGQGAAISTPAAQAQGQLSGGTGDEVTAQRLPAQQAPAGLDWMGLTHTLTGGVKQLAMQCEVVEYLGDRLRLRLPEAHRRLYEGFGDKLRAVLRERLGEALRVEYEFGATQGASPIEVIRLEQAQRQAEAEAAIRADPVVRSLVDEYGGRITDIKPL
ncbi:MAG: DNA polymerase III subunit gamma/tau [Thiobacillaceae bacterium]|nr:DNA polymerase III subunit gamma/tau [Thiobacillaceae bacterium]